VKFSAHKAAVAQSPAERLRRGRAAALAVRAAFPRVQQLRIDFKFEETSSYALAPQSHLLYPPARAFFVFPCPHANCDGQFDLTTIVRSTVADDTLASRGTVVCSGSRALDHGGSKQPCGLNLIYSVTALL